MNMTFHEKSALGSLVAILLVFGNFFAKAYEVFVGESTDGSGMAVGVVVSVVLVIVIQIVYHIVLTIWQGAETQDERGRLIELKSTRIQHFLLTFGVFVSVASLLLSVAPFQVAYVLMAAFILSEIAGHVALLYYYRVGG